MKVYPANFLLLFLGAHTAKSNRVFQLDAGNEKRQLQEVTLRYGFRVFNNAGDGQPDPSDKVDGFVSSCLHSSFDQRPSKSSINTVEVDSASIVSVTSENIGLHDLFVHRDIWLYDYHSSVTLPESSGFHPEWEARFCSCLMEGRSSFEILKTAYDCYIEHEDTSNEGKDDRQNDTALSETMDTTIQQDAYTFKVYNTNETDDSEPIQGDQYDEVVASCLVSAYNSYHDSSRYEILAQEIVDKNVYSIPALSDDSEDTVDNPIVVSPWTIAPHWIYKNFWLYGWRGNLISIACNMCPPWDDDDLRALDESEELLSSLPGLSHQKWEENFCSCLVQEGEREGSAFGILQTAYDCRIRSHIRDETLKDTANFEIEHQVEITFTLQTNHVTKKEKEFIMMTLEEAISSSDDLSDSSAIVYSHTSVNVPDTSQVKYHDDLKRDNSFLRQTSAAGLNANIQGYVISISAAILSIDNLPVSFHDIDDTFCALLASGPFTRLEGISDCKVEEIVSHIETADH